MNNRRVIALILAFFAAMLVIMAEKSCAKSIQETNMRNRKNQTPDITIVAGLTGITATYAEAASEEASGDVTLPTAEVVTDLIGRVVGTVPPLPEGETMEPVEETTAKKSILEAYNEQKAAKEGASGPTAQGGENGYADANNDILQENQIVF